MRNELPLYQPLTDNDLLFLLRTPDDEESFNGDEVFDSGAFYNPDNEDNFVTEKRYSPVVSVDSRRAFSSWAGKRSVDVPGWGAFPKQRDFFGIERPSDFTKRAAFSAWAGKRSSDDLSDLETALKRAAFSAWAGKRSDPYDDVMKRAAFSAWAGKRSSFDDELNDSGDESAAFFDWPEKRAAFNAWAGKRKRLIKRAAFSAWQGKRNDNSGKRSDETVASNPPRYDNDGNPARAQYNNKRPAFSAWP
nr:hypothetical protein BaRGS_011765 [Batillaria attramentaria]